ncbi:hypothetical protein M758_UG337600 [Ceratodon purpureus]|nr:hypothetical protein M758_UG337600 [Ceratodon purpureus]
MSERRRRALEEHNRGSAAIRRCVVQQGDAVSSAGLFFLSMWLLWLAIRRVGDGFFRGFHSERVGEIKEEETRVDRVGLPRGSVQGKWYAVRRGWSPGIYSS